jgi:exodeoxyribonuclease VII large subunit
VGTERVAAGARPGERELPLSVEALMRAVSLLLERNIGTVWVEGEVSNLRVHGSGHVYFVLKDRGGQVPAVIWRSTAQRLRFRLADGQKLLVRARPAVFADQGKLQLYIENAEPAGLGAAALALEQLKQKLAKDGLFAAERKRSLPRLPRRVGLVTSPTGAAIKDVVTTIERRFPVAILVCPARVQGDGAAIEIAAAIRRIGRARIDVLIVGRGGGSAEDLSAFNEEPVVRAIASCPVPVVSAVGHEVDVTLADLAADVRAATPTAAAELVVPERTVLARQLGELESRLRRGIQARVDGLRARLGRGEKRLAGLEPSARLAADRGKLGELEARLEAAARAGVERRRRGFAAAAARLDAMSPLRVLERGYAIARTPEGAVVTDAEQVAPGDALELRLARGALDVRVEGKK